MYACVSSVTPKKNHTLMGDQGTKGDGDDLFTLPPVKTSKTTKTTAAAAPAAAAAAAADAAPASKQADDELLYIAAAPKIEGFTPMSQAYDPDLEYDEELTPGGRWKRRMLQNPFVPAGMMITTGKG